MEILEHYISLAAKSIFIENILLAYFLGMCSFLAVSKKIEASIGLGKAVIFVNGVTVPLNWIIKHYLLDKGALIWTGIPSMDQDDLGFLSFIAFIATIAAMRPWPMGHKQPWPIGQMMAIATTAFARMRMRACARSTGLPKNREAESIACSLKKHSVAIL